MQKIPSLILSLLGTLTFAGCATSGNGEPHQTTSLFDGKTLDGWIQSPANAWTVKDGAMASLGAGRGVIYTKDDYASFRLIFTMRHLPSDPGQDHQACVLFFCTRPQPGVKELDALGGIQFQIPGYPWDYRPGRNTDKEPFFTHLPHPKFNPNEWSRVEILVSAKNGTARLAVAQPVGTKAVEILDFKDPSAGHPGPIALQMHNQGLHDEYKDITVEVDPKVDELVTVK